MLMALGWAAVTTFAVLWMAKLARAKDLALPSLPAEGVRPRCRAAGWVFAAFAVPWIGLTAHSGWVRHHEAAGARAFERSGFPTSWRWRRRIPMPG